MPNSIQLKSSQNDSGMNSAVLCTPYKTYDIRQVSTSNTVFVTESTSKSKIQDGSSQPVLKAISQPQSTLELLPCSATSAIPYIVAALPSYTSTQHNSSTTTLTKDDLFANIPLSDGQCEAGWIELACFESGDGRHAVVPTASVKTKVWEAILGAATATGIDLTGELGPDDLSRLLNMESDWPEAVTTAVLRSMSTSYLTSSVITLDPELCAKRVGQALLKDLSDTARGSISAASFKTKWADLLPEKWRSHAALNLLNGCYRLENGGKDILLVEDSLDTVAAVNGGSTGGSKSTLGAKRKWHEKFRASKKAA